MKMRKAGYFTVLLLFLLLCLFLYSLMDIWVSEDGCVALPVSKKLHFTVGWMVGWLDGWMVRWLDGWMVGWLDGWMVGWLDG